MKLIYFATSSCVSILLISILVYFDAKFIPELTQDSIDNAFTVLGCILLYLTTITGVFSIIGLIYPYLIRGTGAIKTDLRASKLKKLKYKNELKEEKTRHQKEMDKYHEHKEI